jgi:putative hydrolase of the HAD superfamily
MQLPDFDWIFFDCFNTLIDDVDSTGEDGGLLSVPQLAVECGFFGSPAEFHAAYAHVRAQTLRNGREMPLHERLRQTLQAAPAVHSREECVAVSGRLQAAWEAEYVSRLRPTPGVEAMLKHWYARRALAVVTNTLLPSLPLHQLERFGLARYFRFVLDSATIGFKKPNPLLTMEALSLAGLGPCDGPRVLMVGDRLDTDIVAAGELGLNAMHFNRRPAVPAALPIPEGCLTIVDWDEFRT